MALHIGMQSRERAKLCLSTQEDQARDVNIAGTNLLVTYHTINQNQAERHEKRNSKPEKRNSKPETLVIKGEKVKPLPDSQEISWSSDTKIKIKSATEIGLSPGVYTDSEPLHRNKRFLFVCQNNKSDQMNADKS